MEGGVPAGDPCPCLRRKGSGIIGSIDKLDRIFCGSILIGKIVIMEQRPMPITPMDAPCSTESPPAAIPSGLGDPTRISRYRWVILALLFFAITINYVDRLVMAMLGPELCKTYSISNKTFGYITGAFAIAYALGQLASGAWLDKIGTRLGFMISLTLWSLASALHATVPMLALAGVSIPLGFGIMRTLLGVSESPSYPAAVKTISEWFPKRERAFAMGVVNGGSNLGAILAPAVVPWLAFKFGWQAAFIGTGAIGLVWLCFWIPMYRRPQEHPRCSPAELAYINSDPPEPVTKVPWLTLIGYRQAWGFALSKFITDSIWWFYMTWIPLFFSRTFDLTPQKIGLPLIVVYVMADLGSIGGGFISSYLIQHGWSINKARKFTLLACALCVTPLAFAGHVTSQWGMVYLLGLATAAHQGFSSNQYTLVSDMFPRRAVGSVSGLGGTLGYIGASLYAVFCGGHLDKTHDNYSYLFIIAGLAYLVAFAIIHLFAPRLEAARMDEIQQETNA